MNSLSPIFYQLSPRLREEGPSEAVRKADPKGILASGQLHPGFRNKLERLIERASQNGLQLLVQEGYRSPEAQAKIPAGNTRAKPGYSFHNYGLAADIVFADERGRPSWSERHDWQALGRLGKELGLEWGGDWSRIVDRPHFQYVPSRAIGEIRRLYEEGGMPKVWNAY